MADDDLTIEEYQALMQAELEEWQKLGTDPARAVIINTFTLDSYFFALRDLLIEKGIFTKEEADKAYYKNVLKNMAEQREGFKEFKQNLERERIAAGVPKMVLPKGINRKH